MRVKKSVVIDVSPGTKDYIIKRLQASNIPDKAICTKVSGEQNRIYIESKNTWSTTSWCEMTFEWEDDE